MTTRASEVFRLRIALPLDTRHHLSHGRTDQAPAQLSSPPWWCRRRELRGLQQRRRIGRPGGRFGRRRITRKRGFGPRRRNRRQPDAVSDRLERGGIRRRRGFRHGGLRWRRRYRRGSDRRRSGRGRHRHRASHRLRRPSSLPTSESASVREVQPAAVVDLTPAGTITPVHCGEAHASSSQGFV